MSTNDYRFLYAVPERDHSTPTRTVCCEQTRSPGVRIVVCVCVGGGGGVAAGRGGYILCSPSQVFVTTNDAYRIVWLCCLRCFYTKYNPIDDHTNISSKKKVTEAEFQTIGPLYLRQCSTTGVTKAVVCVILSVG